MTSQTPGGRSIMFSTLIFVSLNLVTVLTVRILIKLMTQLLYHSTLITWSLL